MPQIQRLLHIGSLRVNPALVKNHLNRDLFLDELIFERIDLEGHNSSSLAVNTCIASDEDL